MRHIYVLIKKKLSNHKGIGILKMLYAVFANNVNSLLVHFLSVLSKIPL